MLRGLLGGLTSLLDVELWFRRLPKNLVRSNDRLSTLLQSIHRPGNSFIANRTVWLLDEHCFLENVIFTFLELKNCDVDPVVNEFYSTVLKLIRAWLLRSGKARFRFCQGQVLHNSILPLSVLNIDEQVKKEFIGVVLVFLDFHDAYYKYSLNAEIEKTTKCLFNTVYQGFNINSFYRNAAKKLVGLSKPLKTRGIMEAFVKACWADLFQRARKLGYCRPALKYLNTTMKTTESHVIRKRLLAIVESEKKISKQEEIEVDLPHIALIFGKKWAEHNCFGQFGQGGNPAKRIKYDHSGIGTGSMIVRRVLKYISEDFNTVE